MEGPLSTVLSLMAPWVSLAFMPLPGPLRVQDAFSMLKCLSPSLAQSVPHRSQAGTQGSSPHQYKTQRRAGRG